MAGGTIPGATLKTGESRWPVSLALADGLGWFSLGLGAFELLAPARLARSLGVSGREGLIRAYGLREIAAGIALLGATDRRPWLWVRAGGDALDLITLLALARLGDRRGIAIATAAVLGVTALDVACARAINSDSPNETTIRRSIEIGLPTDALMGLCCRPDTLPRAVATVATVTAEPDGSTHWTVRGPGRRTALWTMGAVGEHGGTLAWSADGGKPLVRAIEASFRPAPAGRGTVLSLDLHLATASSVLDRAALSLLDGKAARILLDTALHRIKSLAETGEIPTTERQPAARADTR